MAYAAFFLQYRSRFKGGGRENGLSHFQRAPLSCYDLCLDTFPKKAKNPSHLTSPPLLSHRKKVPNTNFNNLPPNAGPFNATRHFSVLDTKLFFVFLRPRLVWCKWNVFTSLHAPHDRDFHETMKRSRKSLLHELRKAATVIGVYKYIYI